MRPAVIVFAKAPVPGRVKTRLCPPLAHHEAAAVHTAFVADTLGLLQTAGLDADIELHTDTPTDAWRTANVSTMLQADGGLGVRLYHAIGAALDRGRPRVIVLGSDSPTLPVERLEWLLHASADVALGPCEDGGYYGISCKRHHPAMFDGVRFSTPHAMETTLAAAAGCGLTTEVGEQWFDVDEPDSLERLVRTPHLPPHTERCLSGLRLPS